MERLSKVSKILHVYDPKFFVLLYYTVTKTQKGNLPGGWWRRSGDGPVTCKGNKPQVNSYILFVARRQQPCRQA